SVHVYRSAGETAGAEDILPRRDCLAQRLDQRRKAPAPGGTDEKERIRPILAETNREGMMKITTTAIVGVVILEPKVFGDERGYFFESFSQREFEEKVCKTTFVQDNESSSRYGVLRGLHFQKPPHAQAKLVRVVKGKVLDIAVDIRKGSPTFGHHVSIELSGENKRQLFIPRGFAHGFAVLSDEVVFQYKC